MSPEDLPDSLSIIRDALAGHVKSIQISNDTYESWVDSFYFCRSLVEVLLDSDDIFTRLKLADMWEVFAALCDGQTDVDRVAIMKYWTAWPMARWLNKPAGHNVMPVRPPTLPPVPAQCDFPIHGALRKHFRNLLATRTTNVRAGQLFNSILQGVKRGCAPVGEGFERVSCQKHKKSLSKPVELTHEQDFLKKFGAIWGRPNLPTSGDSAPKWVRAHRKRPFRRRLYNASNHASVEAKRSDGGRKGAITQKNLELIGEGDDVETHCPSSGSSCGGDSPSNSSSPFSGCLNFLVELGFPVADCDEELTPPSGIDTVRDFGLNSLVELVGTDAARDLLALPSSGIGPGKSTSPLVRGLSLLDMYELNGVVVERVGYPLATYQQFLTAAEKAVKGRNLRAQVELCLEPLKCRVITKGEALPYFVAQTFQKAAWKALQDIPAFKLTSCPVDASMLYGLEMRTKSLGLSFDEWVSGDYSAATDGLSLGINQSCLGSMLNAFDATKEEREVCSKVLGCHEVSYPNRLRRENEPEGENLDTFTMQNGQLMGSVLSFPVLCAVNLAAYWCALEEYTGRKFLKEELPCLVNGDDILFKSNLDFYPVWQKWVGRAGFTLSPGKNYISPNYITVNSESWLHKGGSTFRKLPFLNCGLLLQEADGPKQIPLRAETAERPLIPKLQWVLDNANNPRRAFDRIKHYWKKSIQIHTQDGRYSLVAPTALGGCGLMLPEVCRQDVYFTEFQKLLAGRAHQMYKSFEDQELRECPATGLETLVMADLPTPLNPQTKSSRVGKLTLRHRMEPKRGEKEVRFGDIEASQRVAADLNVCQTPEALEQPVFRIKAIPRRRLAKVFAAETKISEPFYFDLEMRKIIYDQGPTDDASLPPGNSCGENIAEMATEHFSSSTRFACLITELGIAEPPLFEEGLF